MASQSMEEQGAHSSFQQPPGLIPSSWKIPPSAPDTGSRISAGLGPCLAQWRPSSSELLGRGELEREANTETCWEPLFC